MPRQKPGNFSERGRRNISPLSTCLSLHAPKYLYGETEDNERGENADDTRRDISFT